jgi:hypothetical protein
VKPYTSWCYQFNASIMKLHWCFAPWLWFYGSPFNQSGFCDSVQRLPSLLQRGKNIRFGSLDGEQTTFSFRELRLSAPSWIRNKDKGSGVGDSNVPSELYFDEPRTLIISSIEPHTILDSANSKVWNTSSEAFTTLFSLVKSIKPCSDQTCGLRSASVHAVRAKLADDSPVVYLSSIQITELNLHFLYSFESKPPFRVLTIASEALPIPSSGKLEIVVPSPAEMAPLASKLTLSLFDSATQQQHSISDISKFLPEPVAKPQGLTFVMMSYEKSRLPNALSVLDRYSTYSRSLIHEMFLIWNNPLDVESASFLRARDFGAASPIHVVLADVNSINNRYAVWKGIQTDAVMIQDDDMWLNHGPLSCMFAQYKQHPNQLIGIYRERRDIVPANAFQKSHFGLQWDQLIPGPPHPAYSMLLPHPFVLSRTYLQTYMSNTKMLQLVDNMMNCDDFYLNAVVANATKEPGVAVAVTLNKFTQWGDKTAMHDTDPLWARHRSECLGSIEEMFKDEPQDMNTHTIWRRGFQRYTC